MYCKNILGQNINPVRINPRFKSFISVFGSKQKLSLFITTQDFFNSFDQVYVNNYWSKFYFCIVKLFKLYSWIKIHQTPEVYRNRSKFLFYYEIFLFVDLLGNNLFHWSKLNSCWNHYLPNAVLKVSAVKKIIENQHWSAERNYVGSFCEHHKDNEYICVWFYLTVLQNLIEDTYLFSI